MSAAIGGARLLSFSFYPQNAINTNTHTHTHTHTNTHTSLVLYSFLPTSSSSSSSSSSSRFLTSPVPLSTHHSLSSTSLFPASASASAASISTPNQDDEEQVIGDCLVFEDGIFEDPYLQHQTNPNSTGESDIVPQNLVPEEWDRIVQEINLSKKERRKIAQQLEFGQKIHKKKNLKNVNLEDYMQFRNDKLNQIKPLVLDKPAHFPEAGDDDHHHPQTRDDQRVQPRNPRWAVYGRGLDDITEFFNSGNYQPSDDKLEGRQKLFTQEEKVLMNARMPKLAVATSKKWLPLHTLAASGEFYLLNALLKYNVDIDACDQDGLTALHKAITCKKEAITNYMLRESSNPFVLDKDGATLMHYAVRTSSIEAIKMLLLHNVDINRQDNVGWTPLHVAVQGRRTDVVRLLLMKGADKMVKNQVLDVKPACGYGFFWGIVYREC